MPENEQNQQTDFMIEKIKERPVNKKKLLRRTIITASMAVIFGLIACLTFLILEPVFNKWLYPEEKPQIVNLLPEETDEMLPEDMLVEEPEPNIQETVENVLMDSRQIEEILSKLNLTTEHYSQLYSALSEYTKTLAKSMVTVTGVTSDTDWFNNTYESEDHVSGVVVANNGRELLILADRSVVRQAETINVTFSGGQQVAAVEKQYDSATGLTILSVPLSDIPQTAMEGIVIAQLGASNSRYMAGTPVVAMGSPMGISNSVNYGIITSSGSIWSTTDANYNLLTTDMHGSQYASGVIFNMKSEVIAVITNGKGGSDLKNIITGIGITELGEVINKMSNGGKLAYMGISGTDVTLQANTELGVPFGAYVKDVLMDSPAMLAGIQSGDVIVSMGDSDINNFTNYTKALLRHKPGDTVLVKVRRQVQEDYKEVEFKITLGETK